jgi:hypothetical protein
MLDGHVLMKQQQCVDVALDRQAQERRKHLCDHLESGILFRTVFGG